MTLEDARKVATGTTRVRREKSGSRSEGFLIVRGEEALLVRGRVLGKDAVGWSEGAVVSTGEMVNGRAELLGEG